MSSIDLCLGVLLEMTIVNESKQPLIPLIVDTEYQWEVCIIDLIEFIALQETEVKLALLEGYLLPHTFLDSHLLDIVVLIGCVHHCGHIIDVSLLSHTRVDSQITIA